jgi:hypothetical protein
MRRQFPKRRISVRIDKNNRTRLYLFCRNRLSTISFHNSLYTHVRTTYWYIQNFSLINFYRRFHLICSGNIILVHKVTNTKFPSLSLSLSFQGLHFSSAPSGEREWNRVVIKSVSEELLHQKHKQTVVSTITRVKSFFFTLSPLRLSFLFFVFYCLFLWKKWLCHLIEL